MSYIEVVFSCTSNSDDTHDIITAFIADLGFESFASTDTELTAYISEELFNTESLDNTIKEIPLTDDKIDYTYTKIQDQNWNQEWESNSFTPIEIDNQCIIQSTTHSVNDLFAYNIFINPEMSFGTGHHQTTEMMMKYILQLDVAGKSILDMGCGTAVLAILASMKGAQPIDAIDIDQWAYNNSLENVQLNKIDNINIIKGDANVLGSRNYDIILANINRNILLKDIACYAAVLNNKGTLVMSGFYTEDIPVLEIEYSKLGLKLEESREKEGWAAIRLTKIS